VLIYLALERDTTRDQVLSVFWPERDTVKARGAFNQTLLELRRALGEEWLERQGDNLVVTEALELDASRFAALLKQGSREAALELYGGEFLKGQYLANTREFEEWVDRHRGRLSWLHRGARREAVTDWVQRGDLARALHESRRWVELEPLERDAQHSLIELLARNGEQAEALRQYEAYSRLLEAEEIEPLSKTKALVEKIRAGEFASAVRPVMPVKVEPTGVASGESRVTLDDRLAVDLSPEFAVIREIGQGRMALVYLARERALQRLVAVKVLRPELASDDVVRARFEREARSVARLVHPNVVAIHRVGLLRDGTPYLVMEYVEGRNLADTLAAEGALSDVEACDVVAQIAAALAAAHAHGVIHRDVRPANIVWTRESGRAVLMDFGTAAIAESGRESVVRLTMHGEKLGIPAYNSPEQLRGDSVSSSTDIYSLGVVGYEILTLGRPPAAEVNDSAAADPSPLPESLTTLRPGTNPELADLLQRCLAFKPEHRPSTPQLARLLERLLDDLRTASQVPDPVPAPQPDPPIRKTPLQAFLEELKQREVYKVALVYVGIAAVLVQTQPIFEVLRMPVWSFPLLVSLVLGGFPIALIMAWMFDSTKAGIRRTPTTGTKQYRAALRAFQIAGLAISVLLATIVGWWILSG
jgi:serine/threonine protein kinase/DNA-binding SARP family transcriptional activator